MIHNSSISTREPLQSTDSQEPHPSPSNAAKAFKYGMYGGMALGFGCVTVTVNQLVQSHFNQPARDFVYDHCFANETTYDAQNKYAQLLDQQFFPSFFANAVLSGSIIVVSNILYNVGKNVYDFVFFPPTHSDTVNQPVHRHPPGELTNTNEQSSMV